MAREDLLKYPLRKIVGKKRRVLGETEINSEKVEIAVMDELLECGHSQSPREDFFGDTVAAKRRCQKCPKGQAGKPKKGKK